MILKNVTLNTAELGPVKWESVEKLQPGSNGFICFIDSHEETKTDENGEEQTYLVGTYFNTGFSHKPSYKEVINMLIQSEYPNGKEQEMLRFGIHNPNDEDYLEYYNRAEQIRTEIRQILNQTNE